MVTDYKPKPKKYNRFKKFVAKRAFTIRRKLIYLVDGKRYTKKHISEQLNYEIFTHRSLLMRKLKDVDMYLQKNKVTNLKLAINKIDKIIINPGETFSVWKLVGKPSKRKGYLEGLMLTNGKINKGVGGGLCQLGNLIYWMALHSPLEVTERWRHSYDVFPDVNRKLPFGSGATLSYNYVDLQLHNPTEEVYQINLWLTDEYLHGNICSNKPLNVIYEVYEDGHKIVHQWWGGYTRHNRIFRKITYLYGKEEIELVAENHAVMMYAPMLEE